MIFKIEWNWISQNKYWIFEGPEKTYKEFCKDVCKAIKESTDDYLKQENGISQLDNWLEFSLIQLKRMGYEEIELMTFHLNNHDPYVDENQVKSSKREWIKIVGEKNYLKAVEHSKRISSDRKT